MAYITFWDVADDFDVHDWMEQVADKRQCSGYKVKNGRVVEVVFNE